MSGIITHKVMVTSSGDISGLVCNLDDFQKGDILYLPNMNVNYLKYVIDSLGIITKN